MHQTITKKSLLKRSDFLYEIPPSFRPDMRVPARLYASEAMLDQVLADKSLWQLVNMTTLPGIKKYALAMPDIHEGYGFPIGGVAAMAVDEEGVISPGGIGYDINCGVRMLVANLPYNDVKPYLKKLAKGIFQAIPSGTGKSGTVKLSLKDLDVILQEGAERMLALGFGEPADLEYCESNGFLKNASSRHVSALAKERGKDQLGSLGSGNHFLEIQMVDRIFDEEAAKAFGLSQGSLTVMIHCGSRGLGHQVCSDYVQRMLSEQQALSSPFIDKQLAYAPFTSICAQDYFSAMNAAANFAFANRQMIAHRIREVFKQIMGSDSTLRPIYDVAHNIGKLETHTIDGTPQKLIVHRKGATRAFPPHHKELPSKYRSVGQPVLIPGTMGTFSYVLKGSAESMDQTFGSSCHGAGRAMSRHQAKKQRSGDLIRKDLHQEGILIECVSSRGLSEEAPYAYKNIHDVIDSIVGAHIAQKVARLRPLAVIKGD